MNILVNENELILAQGENIEYGVYDEPLEKWKVVRDNFAFYVMSDKCNVYEVDIVPLGVDDGKYCYNATNGFYSNPDYSDPINTEEEIKRLMQENIDLQAQLDKVQEVLDYLVMQ